MSLSTIRRILILTVVTFLSLSQTCKAQIGDHRDDFAVGFGGGYVLSNIGFTQKVTQGLHSGVMGGIVMRYVCEKYFNTIASVVAEVNYAQTGWKEDILTAVDQPVINAVTGQKEEYSRTINYVQVPFFAHLAWGRERNGANFFVQAGPQFGAYLSESTKTNFSLETANIEDRANKTTAQYSMEVEKKFDYGIAAGLGMEYSAAKIGHFVTEARYYFGLGNIYGATKKDYFSKSNHGNIIFKLSYLFDIKRTKNPNIR